MLGAKGSTVPANRSRTERWRRSLEQILERGGGIELSVPVGRGSQTEGRDRSGDLLWRVRLLDLTDELLTVEMPGAFGRTVPLPIGVSLVCVMSVGQNQWMFHSTVDRIIERPGRYGPPGMALQIRMPERVERCQRRHAYRVSTASLNLPQVECWPILDPTTVIAAEVANRASVRQAGREDADPSPEGVSLTLPEVGPRFPAQLANLSGGGVGLVGEPGDRGFIEGGSLFWLRFDLRPRVAAPLGVTARLVHSHLDSEQRTHAGFAFEFQFNPAHRGFVSDQIGRYIASLREDMDRSAA